MYSPSAFYMSISISSFVLGWMYPIILGLCTFYWLDLNESTFPDCLEFVLILYLIAMAGNYTGITFGAIFSSHDNGFRYMQILVIAFNMAAGIFVNTSKSNKQGMSDWLVYYLQFVSPARATCELMLRREIAGKNTFVQSVILQFLGYTWGYRTCYLFMVGYILFIWLLGWAVLVFKARKI